MKDPVLFTITLVTITYCILVVSLEWRTGRLASPLAITAGLSLVHFCLPAWLQSFSTGYAFVNPDNERYVTEAMLFVLAMLLAMHGGVWGAARWYRGSAEGPLPDTAQLPWLSPNVLIVCGFLSMVGWASRIYVIESHAYFQFARTVQGEMEGPFYAAIRMAELFPMHVLFILTIHSLGAQQQGRRSWNYLVFGAMLFELAYWLPTGRKEESILILLVPMLIRYVVTGALPSAPVRLLLVSFVVLLFPAAHYYRFFLQKLVLLSDDMLDVMTTAVTTIDSDVADETEASAEDIIVQRLDLLEPVSACIGLVARGSWPLELGGSYAMALLAFIPRVLWPSKPDLHYGTDFGHAAGIITDSNDWFTSISVTFPGEAFLNFGWFGWLVFAFIGAGYSLLHEAARHSRWRDTAVLLYAITLQTILFLGGTFALFFGGLLKLLPFYILLGWLMTVRLPSTQSRVRGLSTSLP